MPISMDLSMINKADAFITYDDWHSLTHPIPIAGPFRDELFVKRGGRWFAAPSRDVEDESRPLRPWAAEYCDRIIKTLAAQDTSMRPYPKEYTLSSEEVADAGADGVDVSDVPWLGDATVTYARRGGRWHWTASRTAIASGLFSPQYGVFPVERPEACAALDRVEEHWRLVAEVDASAARVAEALRTARRAAEAHAAAITTVLDSLPVEAGEARRGVLIGARQTIRDIDRLINAYAAASDGSKP